MSVIRYIFIASYSIDTSPHFLYTNCGRAVDCFSIACKATDRAALLYYYYFIEVNRCHYMIHFRRIVHRNSASLTVSFFCLVVDFLLTVSSLFGNISLEIGVVSARGPDVSPAISGYAITSIFFYDFMVFVEVPVIRYPIFTVSYTPYNFSYFRKRLCLRVITLFYIFPNITSCRFYLPSTHS